jgi:hypothetical protein
MIRENVRRILGEIPPSVEVVAAAKGRTPGEILEAIEAGIRIVGENYVQESKIAIEAIGARAKWHMIGRLQRNKVHRAAHFFDLVETVDSLPLACALDAACGRIGKVMPVLVEINSGREAGKVGVLPEEAEGLLYAIANLPHLRVVGLMTMGPQVADPEGARPCFRKTRRLLEDLRSLPLANVDLAVLSMGMSDTYRAAIEEGATMVRIGTKIFGVRPEGPRGKEEG